MSKFLIITGGSKGIGKALAKKYASESYKVYSLARSIVDLQNVTQIPVDLTNEKETIDAFTMVWDEIKKQKITFITLINNAGSLGNISQLENIDARDISQTIFLNTTIPLILSSLFINFTKQLTCIKKIINISSGAAVKPYEGWSVYCTSKAGLDMVTQTIAEEQKRLENEVICIGIRPGVVDTAMQAEIRDTNEQDFMLKQRFIDLKNNNQLYSPNFVANTIYKLDIDNRIESGTTVDIRNIE